MTRLLCFGDLQLGKLASHERAPGDGLRAQADALDKIADLAIRESVDAVVNGGDTFEGPSISPAQIVVYADFVARMASHRIPVLTTLGNGRHDLAQREHTALAVFDHMSGIDTFTRPGIGQIDDVAVCFLPWVHAGRVVAANNGGDRDEINATVAELMLRAARDLLDEVRVDWPHTILHRVLVLHGSIEGAATPAGLPIDMHATDVIPIDDLRGLGFDAIVASHIHVPQAWHDFVGWTRSIAPETPTPPIFYTGSPLPLDFGEGSYAHGVWLLDLDEAVTARFVALESRRFITVDVDLTTDAPDTLGLDETDTVAAAIATRMPIDDEIVRVRIRGTEQQAARIDTAAIKDLLADTHKAYIAFDTVRANRARVEQIDEEMSELDAVELYIAAHDLDDDHVNGLRDATSDYPGRLGAPA